MRREELRAARKYLDETVAMIMAELNGDTVNCQTKTGPDRLCGHSVTQHDGDESGMGGAEGCMILDCSCENFTREARGGGTFQENPNAGRVTEPGPTPEAVAYEEYAAAQGFETTGTKTVTRWADQAMFAAEPIRADEGPKVYLLWMTPDPLAAIAAPSKMYKGEVARSLRDVTHAERHDYVKQILATKLQAPFEFVKMHFLIEGVTRAFTHQMVRQRTAVYAQESLRFAVKEDMPVALPPSIAALPEDHRLRRAWDKFIDGLGTAYRGLVDNGIPAEDARGLLPHNTLTRLHYATDLRALLDHAGNRLCTQAQFEWRLVFARIAEAIRFYNPTTALQVQLANLGESDAVDAVQHCAESDRWQYEVLADLFRPVCYLTGKCEFKANFDRKCSIRDRVDEFHRLGISPSVWGDPDIRERGLRHINPAEWLLDPGAAR